MTTTYGPQSSSDETSSTRSTQFNTSGTRTGYIPFAEVIIKSQDPNCKTTWNLPCEQIGYISDGDARVVTLSLRLGPVQPYDHPHGEWKKQVENITKTAPEPDNISEESDINHNWSIAAPGGKKKYKKGLKKVLKDANLKDRENNLLKASEVNLPKKRGRPRLVKTKNIIVRRGRPRKLSPRRIGRPRKEELTTSAAFTIKETPKDTEVPVKSETIIKEEEPVSTDKDEKIIKKDNVSVAGSERSVTKKRKLIHNTPRCVFPGCTRYRVGTKVDNPKDGGPPGYRCLTHGTGGKTQCQVVKCHQFCVSYTEEDDTFGPPGRRCREHGGWRLCNVPNCGMLTRGEILMDDEYGPKGSRCREHGGKGGKTKSSVQNLMYYPKNAFGTIVQKPVGSRYNNTVMTKVELDEHEQRSLGKSYLSVRLPTGDIHEFSEKPDESVKEEQKIPIAEEISTTVSEPMPASEKVTEIIKPAIKSDIMNPISLMQKNGY